MAFYKKTEDVLKKAAQKIQWLSDYLGERKLFLLDKLTVVDFVFFDLIDGMRLEDEKMEKVPKNLHTYWERMVSIP